MTYRLTESLGYLLNRAGTRSGELFTRRLTPYRISISMYRVLVALHECGHQRLSDLGAMTSIEISTLSRMVGTMMLRGLVWRERVGSDGRTVTISLTEEGHRLAAELIPLAIHHDEFGVQDLDPLVVAQLKRGLVAIYNNLDGIEDELPPPTDLEHDGLEPGARPGLATDAPS